MARAKARVNIILLVWRVAGERSATGLFDLGNDCQYSLPFYTSSDYHAPLSVPLQHPRQAL